MGSNPTGTSNYKIMKNKETYTPITIGEIVNAGHQLRQQIVAFTKEVIDGKVVEEGPLEYLRTYKAVDEDESDTFCLEFLWPDSENGHTHFTDCFHVRVINEEGEDYDQFKNDFCILNTEGQRETEIQFFKMNQTNDVQVS